MGSMIKTVSIFASIFTVEYDYNDITYPISFHDLVNKKESRYEQFGKQFDGLPKEVKTGIIPSYEYQSSDVLLMTGASNNHVFSSFNCLYSMILADPFGSYMYLDLNISFPYRTRLYYHLSSLLSIQQRIGSRGFIVYRRLNWNNFPDWLRIDKNSDQVGGYGWKVIPIMDAFFEWKAVVYWVDAGCIFESNLNKEVSLARHYGLYTPQSSGSIGMWVHNETQEFMLKHGLLHSRVSSNERMGSGGILVLNYQNDTIRNDFSSVYLECAYTQMCISPRGSNMFNHRQDQAILSLLVADLHIPYSARYGFGGRPLHHQDVGMNEQKLQERIVPIVQRINLFYNLSITVYG